MARACKRVAPSITIELTPSQIDRISARLGGNTLRPGLPASVDLGALDTVDLTDGRLSRSLLLGLKVLAVLARDGGWVALSALAARLDMSKTTAHRYVNTLVEVGLVEQDPGTRRYRLTQ